ncbi:hypothetical protein HGRIS_004221 [Hohenbuehelia grisea]|uniref:Calpain catalytic domain-containing protein n=1 Tax=Hohenbuehelia grisea TaxID=104357 RepID=A0ABR3JHU7_9AGAR
MVKFSKERFFPQRNPEPPTRSLTSEFDKAVKDCQARVSQVIKDCREKNLKFRDVEFDLECDKLLCLGTLRPTLSFAQPSDVQRVTEIFDNPQLFNGRASSNDIIQGSIGNCWLLSALAVMATFNGLIENFCVAHDREVGVYGFVFFRDFTWVTVVVDDLLYMSIPKFEELSSQEKQLYHGDKQRYNNQARKGPDCLSFARSATENVTWVSLIEKAYAKLHGDYLSLDGGYPSEAIEDFTGGISLDILTKDIINPDKFWNEELLKATKDRLFSCSFNSLNTSRNGDLEATVHGLIGGHAYSILRAIECRGKRFLVIRNPYGEDAWTGPWSDGSREWSSEWLKILPCLEHTFGNDGQFVMEYDDFLKSWEVIHRTLLLDDSWVLSSGWIQVPPRPLPTAWTFGDVSFTFTIDHPTCAVIVLSKLNDRYFKEVSSHYTWMFDFRLYQKGKPQLVAVSHRRTWRRSVHAEVNLEAGEYVVHIRLDRESGAVTYTTGEQDAWDLRKLSRKLAQRELSSAIAQNYKPMCVHPQCFPRCHANLSRHNNP